jgi:hypothetical protein
MYAPGSRYERIAQAVYVDRDGRRIPYTVLRPFPPVAPSSRLHEVADHERLDLIAYRFYGDPEQFWRLCDGNRTLHPADLEVTGRRIQIPLVVG